MRSSFTYGIRCPERALLALHNNRAVSSNNHIDKMAVCTHGDLTSLAPHERLPELPVIPRLGVGDGQGSLACCSPWGRKELV